MQHPKTTVVGLGLLCNAFLVLSVTGDFTGVLWALAGMGLIYARDGGW